MLEGNPKRHLGLLAVICPPSRCRLPEHVGGRSGVDGLHPHPAPPVEEEAHGNADEQTDHNGDNDEPDWHTASGLVGRWRCGCRGGAGGGHRVHRGWGWGLEIRGVDGEEHKSHQAADVGGAGHHVGNSNGLHVGGGIGVHAGGRGSLVLHQVDVRDNGKHAVPAVQGPGLAHGRLADRDGDAGRGAANKGGHVRHHQVGQHAEVGDVSHHGSRLWVIEDVVGSDHL
mmetsp:Transcript_21188/g.58828  ORF Transcript_21188/g.58828 Transcript_21188/m.58828 type:complete len:227 (+) Transcript_21188:130-810(+)